MEPACVGEIVAHGGCYLRGMRRFLLAAVLVTSISTACAQSTNGGFSGGLDNGGGGSNGGSSGGDDAGGPPPGAFGDDGGSSNGNPVGDPTTCAEAAANRSYIGCDYWPTTTTNFVWSIFDFAVVVANPQQVAATVAVTGANGYSQQVTVAAGGLSKIYLPWIEALKGSPTQWDTCTTPPPFNASLSAYKGAYHLVSSVPVTVYEFNALEYGPQGGPPAKNWSSCPGNQMCDGYAYGCFSYSNDASLLLPSTAMTGNYRLMGYVSNAGEGSFVAVTGTQDGTHVTVKLSSTATVVAGGIVPAGQPGGTISFTLDAGDVAEMVAPGVSAAEDLSGSLLKADKPVQVIAGHPCMAIPQDDPNASCDHIEQSVFPAETLGKHYVVPAPTGPQQGPVGHVVRVYGNVNGTQLTYFPAKPAGCPSTIDAGSVVDCGIVVASFEVQGDHEFEVGTVQQSADHVDPGAQNPEGDPSLSFATPVEQYRSDYIFLAPSDYDMNFADVVVSAGTTLTLDGAPLTVAPASVGPNFSVVRIPLQAGSANGTHVIRGNHPFGIQVLGYGQYTSYQYPGGLDLRGIAPPPAQ
jgi:hypothetical protein